MVVLVDVDGVVADLIPAWLDIYNKEADDNLKVEDITAWEMRQFVKPEYGQRIYDILHYPELYDAVRPVPGALTGIEVLRMRGWRVVFVTSCNEVTAGAKIRWLVRHGFLEEANDKNLRNFVMASDKSLVMQDTLLVDDYPANFDYRDPENCILVDQPWNRDETRFRRATHWGHIVEEVCRGVMV